MKNILILLSAAVMLLLLSRCAKVNVFQEPPDAPVIDSLSPATGRAGTQVRLWGSGFSTITSLDTVWINGVRVRVDSPSTSTVLLVTLLNSTGTGHVRISVKGQSAEGPIFTYLSGGGGQSAPLITNAKYGWADGGGYAVYVNALPATDNVIHLMVGGVEVPIAYVTRPGTTFYDPAEGLRLLVSDNEAVQTNAVDIYANFQATYSGIPGNIYPFQIKPAITDIVSRHGEYSFAAGDTITITGNFFGAPTLPSSVGLVYNGLPLASPSIVKWSNKEIKAVMPAFATVPPDAGIPLSVKVGSLESTPLGIKYLGAISATISVLAGSDQGYAEGTGAAAKFNAPAGIALDASGNLYVADQSNNRIRKITPAGVVTTVAGSSTAGFRDGGAADAWFNQPAGVAVDETGAVYVADYLNNRIRIISNGIVSTFSGDGGTGQYWYPTGVAMNNHNLVYVADMNHHRIQQVLNATLFTLAGGLQGFSDGTGAAAKFNQPYGVALDANGTIYVADQSNHAIRRITTTGVVTTLAGGTDGKADGTGTAAQFELPRAVALDPQGNIYVADFYSLHLRKITPDGVVSTVAALAADGSEISFSAPAGIAIDAQGVVYVSDAGTHRIYKVTF
jgi:sugar lactone lactonase YvrE